MKSILVASNNKQACEVVRSYFSSAYEVMVVSSKSSCLAQFRKKRYEFTFIDVELIRGSGLTNGPYDYKTGLQAFRQVFPNALIIVMSPQKMIREAVSAVKAGASDYLTYPIDHDELTYVIETLQESIRLKSELDYLRDSVWDLEVVKTNSPVLTRVFDKVRSVAPTKTTVLLTGETGTGKGVIARIIHRQSKRRDAQFISVHCGAIPDTLLESELFGHERGAFTGADRRKLGKFEIAHGGTIFLDEIGTITPPAQIKLLQVLQDKRFQRVGGEVDIETDVRIIAATNTDLKKLSKDGLFRNDLYYRLSVFPIEIPPLRERKKDIPLFINAFLKRLNKLYAKNIEDLHPLVLEAFERYSWPGNIRELDNLIERAYILESSPMLTPESFPSELFTPDDIRAQIPFDTSLTLAQMRRRGIETLEQNYLKDLLALHRGRIQRTAEAAGISARQLHKLMKRHGLRKEDFK
jgi:DNA-binding NtrC family response regulator